MAAASATGGGNAADGWERIRMERNQLGGSLPVPNVQSLAASCVHSAASVPDRYLRPDAAGAAVVDGGDQIPVIDLGRLLGDDCLSSRDEAAKLRFASEDWGFFQLVNHGVGEEVVEAMKAAMEGFFEQPLEEKTASSKQPPGSIEGYGQAFVVSEEQKLDWGDMLFLYTQPATMRNIQLWPTHPPNFREAFERYSGEVKKVALSLLGEMGRELGVEVTGLFAEAVQGMRMNYYPACQRHADRLLGISPHSDATGLTVLLQVNGVQGLQIRRAGRWIPVRPLPGAFVVNVGDVLEILSNGRYKSIEHRAIINPDKARLSIAAFHGLNVDCPVGPLPELLQEDQPRFQTLSAVDYVRLVVSTKLDGKSLLDTLKIKG